MPGIMLPDNPRWERFVEFDKKLDLHGLTELCNEVYDRYGWLIETHTESDRLTTQLLTGDHKAKTWAFHEMERLFKASLDARLEAYYPELAKAAEEACHSPEAVHLHRTIQEALNIKPAPSMSTDEERKLRTAITAVINLEEARDKKEASRKERQSATTAVEEAFELAANGKTDEPVEEPAAEEPSSEEEKPKKRERKPKAAA